MLNGVDLIMTDLPENYIKFMVKYAVEIEKYCYNCDRLYDCDNNFDEDVVRECLDGKKVMEEKNAKNLKI